MLFAIEPGIRTFWLLKRI